MYIKCKYAMETTLYWAIQCSNGMLAFFLCLLPTLLFVGLHSESTSDSHGSAILTSVRQKRILSPIVLNPKAVRSSQSDDLLINVTLKHGPKIKFVERLRFQCRRPRALFYRLCLCLTRYFPDIRLRRMPKVEISFRTDR